MILLTVLLTGLKMPLHLNSLSRLANQLNRDILAYPYVPVKGCYGYISVPLKFLYGDMAHTISRTIFFPVGLCTLDQSHYLKSHFRCSDLNFLPAKKTFSEYSTYISTSPDLLPLKEDIITVVVIKTMHKYLTYLFKYYTYMYLIKRARFSSIIRDKKKIKAKIKLYRAVDVLPPEYSCTDCIILKLIATNETSHILMFSNIPDVLNVDGESFTPDPYTKREARGFLDEVFLAVKKFPIEEAQKLKKIAKSKIKLSNILTWGDTSTSSATIYLNDFS